MALTKEQKHELQLLRNRKVQRLPLMQKQFDRINELHSLDHHGCCTNPSCHAAPVKDRREKCKECRHNVYDHFKYYPI